MNSREEINSQELAAHLFQLLNNNTEQQWNLIDKIPEKFLIDGMLELEGIDFTLFGYQIHDINFKNCVFKSCRFVSQIIRNCNFSESTFTDTRFDSCRMDKKSGDSLPEEMNKKFVNYDEEDPWNRYGIHLYEDVLPCDEIVSAARNWVSVFERARISAMEFHLPFLATSQCKEEDISKYLYNILKPLNSQYDTIIMNSRSGFYSFYPFCGDTVEKYYRSWKLHISVDKTKIKQAFNYIAKILLDNDDICNFKILDLSIDESRRGERLSNGAQFTVYLYQDGLKPLGSEGRYKLMMQQITEQLQLAGIAPGVIPESDGKTHSPYFSLRNDGDVVFQYYPGCDSGRNYNPYNLPCVFDFLLLEGKKTFNVEEHFTSFNLDTDIQIARALLATLIALVNATVKPEYVCKSMYNDMLSNLNMYSLYNEYKFLTKKDLMLNFVRENTSACDLIVLMQLMGATDYRSGLNEDNLSADPIIKFIEAFDSLSQPVLRSEMGSQSGLVYAIRNDILNNADHSLLEAISQLYKLILKYRNRIPDGVSIYDGITRYVKPHSFKDDQKFNVYYSSRSDLFKKFINDNTWNMQSLMQDGILSYDQLLMLDEERQALLISYPDNAIELLKSDVGIDLIKKMPLDVLYGVLNKAGHVKELCKVTNITLSEFLNFEYNAIILTLSDPENIKSILVCFGITLDEFIRLPMNKIDVLLGQSSYSYKDKCVSISFNKLMSYPDRFIKNMIQKSQLSCDFLNETMMHQLSQLSDDVLLSCLADTNSLRELLVNYSLTFEQIHYLTSMNHSNGSLVENLDIITLKLGVSTEKFLAMTEDVQKILFNHASSIADLLKHYSISLDDVLNSVNTRKLDILKCSGELLSVAKELKISYSDILAALNVIEKNDKMNFYRVADVKQKVQILMKHGVPFEKMFKLEESDFCELSVNSSGYGCGYGGNRFWDNQTSTSTRNSRNRVEEFINKHFTDAIHDNQLDALQTGM